MSLLASTTQTFVAPQLDWAALSPVIVVIAAAVLGVLGEAFLPRAARRTTQLVLAVVGLLGALLAIGLLWADPPVSIGLVTGPAGEQPLLSMVVDRTGLLLQATIVLLSLLAVLTMAERGRDTDPFAPQASSVPGSAFEDAARRAGLVQTEVLPLTMFAVGGMMVFATAGDLLTMFIALEVFSLPLYVLCGLARRRRLLSQEASLKYFLLGAFSSALFLFGVALIYGATTTVELVPMAQAAVGDEPLPLVIAGVVLVLAGLLFKVGAVPFHSWTPDVYTGAPTAVTGFMAACTKIAAFGALLKVLFVGMQGLQPVWAPAVVVAAVLSMVVGSVVAITQDDVKRMLAYSSIAHAGFILTAFVVVSPSALSAVLFYLVAYGFTTIAAFGVVTLVRATGADGGVGGEATHLSQWAGLARRSPLLAAVFSLLLLAMAGIPLTSGFVGKFAVFSAAVEGGYAWLAVVGVVASAAAAFFYVRVIVLMYFTDPAQDTTTVSGLRPFTTAAVAVGALVTLLLGVFPAPVLDLTDTAAQPIVAVDGATGAGGGGATP